MSAVALAKFNVCHTHIWHPSGLHGKVAGLLRARRLVVQCICMLNCARAAHRGIAYGTVKVGIRTGRLIAVDQFAHSCMPFTPQLVPKQCNSVNAADLLTH